MKRLALASLLAMLCLGSSPGAPVLAGESDYSPLACDRGRPLEPAEQGNPPFAFKLYAELLKKDSGKNLFVSPWSIAAALAMAMNGAEGSTRERMGKALELRGLDSDQINGSFARLAESLQGFDPQVSLGIAYSLWAKKGVVFRDAFLESCRDFYKAEAAAIDFDAKAPDAIDAWVKERTQGRIANMAPRPVDAEAVLVLLNAVCFKGQWQTSFEKDKTKQLPFYRLDGTKKPHPMMHRKGEFPYYRGDRFQAASLAYGDGRLSMLLFLPDEGVSLGDFHAQLTAENWAVWMGKLQPAEGTVVLPCFKMEYETSLAEPLKSLGMAEAFARGADFSGMCAGQDLFISQVKHKAFVEVNEEGTEAAAATSVGMRADQSESSSSFRICCARPFFYAIRDNQTGAILFMGSLVDPG